MNGGFYLMNNITFLCDKNSYLNTYKDLYADKFKAININVTFINDSKDLPRNQIVFILSYYKILKESDLAKNLHNIVIHESNLPNGKGWSPASWNILEGRNKLTLTLFEANEKYDAGDIYFKDTISLSGDELADEWRKKIALKKLDMCIQFVSNLKYYESHKTPQELTNIQESFYPKRTPVDSKLDVNKSIQDQFNLLRIVDNELYPAYFELNGCEYVLKIYKSR